MVSANAASRVGAGPWLIALLVVATHILVNIVTPYEIHRDEFLYAAMGRHLSLFQMDFPPLIAMLADVQRFLFGDTIWGLRMVPAVLHGVLVLLAARIVTELGGDRRAQWLVALVVALSPIALRPGSLFQPVVLDQVAWTVGYLALARIAHAATPRAWVLLGAAIGVGLLAKFSIAFFAVGVVAAVLLTPHRRWLLTRWPWIAAALALLIGSPSITGQLALGWPVRQQMQDLQASQLAVVTPGEFLLEQLRFGPIAWLGIVGLVALVADGRLKQWRVLAIATVATAVLLLALHGKGYYLAPIWFALAPAGAVWVSRTALGARRWLVPATVALTLGYGLVIGIPLGLPILPKERMAAYADRLGLTSAVRTNLGETAELPQDYADMLGWEVFVREVARAWNALPKAERATAALVATNYGRAGALDWYGPRYGLPASVCPCGSYWFWGPGNRTGDVAIVAGGAEAELQAVANEVALAGRVDDPWRVGEERSVPVWVVRGVEDAACTALGSTARQQLTAPYLRRAEARIFSGMLSDGDRG